MGKHLWMILFACQAWMEYFIIHGCIDKNPDYCHELVENSICNHIKNECFCRPGSVAIREDEKLSCKTCKYLSTEY